MKHNTMTVLMASFWLGWSAAPANAQTNQPAGSVERIGVYDSRVIAYAHFWSEKYQRKLNDLKKAAKEAQAAGETQRFNELETALKKEQERNHLQVFSTAPVDEMLGDMKERVKLVQKEASVSRLVSKWDDQALKAYKRNQQVDVTDLLLRDFKLGEKQKKVIEELRRKEPLPLKKAEELLLKGEL